MVGGQRGVLTNSTSSGLNIYQFISFEEDLVANDYHFNNQSPKQPKKIKRF